MAETRMIQGQRSREQHDYASKPDPVGTKKAEARPVARTGALSAHDIDLIGELADEAIDQGRAPAEVYRWLAEKFDTDPRTIRRCVNGQLLARG